MFPFQIIPSSMAYTGSAFQNDNPSAHFLRDVARNTGGLMDAGSWDYAGAAQAMEALEGMASSRAALMQDLRLCLGAPDWAGSIDLASEQLAENVVMSLSAAAYAQPDWPDQVHLEHIKACTEAALLCLEARSSGGAGALHLAAVAAQWGAVDRERLRGLARGPLGRLHPGPALTALHILARLEEDEVRSDGDMAYAALRMSTVARANIQALKSPEKLSRDTRRSLAKVTALLAAEARRLISGDDSPVKSGEAATAPLKRPAKVTHSTCCSNYFNNYYYRFTRWTRATGTGSPEPSRQWPGSSASARLTSQRPGLSSKKPGRSWPSREANPWTYPCRKPGTRDLRRSAPSSWRRQPWSPRPSELPRPDLDPRYSPYSHNNVATWGGLDRAPVVNAA